MQLDNVDNSVDNLKRWVGVGDRCEDQNEKNEFANSQATCVLIFLTWLDKYRIVLKAAFICSYAS